MATRFLVPQDLRDCLDRFTTEEACIQALRERFTTPPSCPRCEKETTFRLGRRAFVCRCGYSRSVTYGTPFYRMKANWPSPRADED